MMKRLVILLMAVVGAACDSGVDPPTATNPTVQPIPDQAVPWEGVSIELLDYFDDADGDPLTFTVQNGNGNIKDELHALSTLVLTPIDIGIRSGAITVIAADPSGASISTVFTAVTILAFREDWDSPESLNRWKVHRDPDFPGNRPPRDPSFVDIKDGFIYLYPASNKPLQKSITVITDISPPVEIGWTIEARVGLTSLNLSANGCSGILYHTDHPIYEKFFLGFGYSGNWEMWGVHRPDGVWYLLEPQIGELVWPSSLLEELATISVSLSKDGVMSLARDGEVFASFEASQAENLSTGRGPMEWPPPDGFPVNMTKLEFENKWWCGSGASPTYPPNGGVDREQRNIIRMDWIQVNGNLR